MSQCFFPNHLELSMLTFYYKINIYSININISILLTTRQKTMNNKTDRKCIKKLWMSCDHTSKSWKILCIFIKVPLQRSVRKWNGCVIQKEEKILCLKLIFLLWENVSICLLCLVPWRTWKLALIMILHFTKGKNGNIFKTLVLSCIL